MSNARFISFGDVADFFRGKTVAIVGSAPSCLNNDVGFVDSHDIVVRVNNFKLGRQQGQRVSVHYSFYGSSIRTDSEVLKKAGTKLCMCKLPNSKPIESEWHDRMKKPHGVDYRYIYKNRKLWWFCDTFIPTDEHFLRTFRLLGNHQPTTGFAAIQDVISCAPRSVYLTGFDFFSSRMHNVNEPWREGHLDDPIRHRPDFEAKWLFEASLELPILFDRKLLELNDQRAKEARRARQHAAVNEAAVERP